MNKLSQVNGNAPPMTLDKLSGDRGDLRNKQNLFETCGKLLVQTTRRRTFSTSTVEAQDTVSETVLGQLTTSLTEKEKDSDDGHPKEKQSKEAEKQPKEKQSKEAEKQPKEKQSKEAEKQPKEKQSKEAEKKPKEKQSKEAEKNRRRSKAEQQRSNRAV
ncbi:hypothetical protein OS493_026289 [Desmophyllum pertusum]|uniref:Uncharacterized protein n=1 Tax=Desmophyllum pertusum TaxID=174260 RepID=A0A9X0D2Y0_9CNID|nr:hypothetical protein OS493_026289 [Desmophyllum pertusum]